MDAQFIYCVWNLEDQYYFAKLLFARLHIPEDESQKKQMELDISTLLDSVI